MLKLWDPHSVEESLSFIGWPNKANHQSENHTMSTILKMTEQLNVFDNADCDFEVSSSSSSKETSPTVDFPTLSSSVPNICPNNCKSHQKIDEGTELQFHNDYFKCDREERGSLNHSFRSVRSAKFNEQGFSFESHKMRGLTNDFKSSASLEQVSYRCLIEGLGNDKRKVRNTVFLVLYDGTNITNIMPLAWW